MRIRSEDNNKEATVEYEKYGLFKAYVYEKNGGEWLITHTSTPTINKNKAELACKRFAKIYF